MESESMECLNKDVKKEKRTDPVHCRYRANQFATSAKLLDTTHKSYGFSACLIETINL